MKKSAFVRSMLLLAAAVVTVVSRGSSPITAACPAAPRRSQRVTAIRNPFATGGFPDAVQDGVTGRNVVLQGDIEGTNFEPGTCHPGVDSVFGLHCFLFGDGAGQFTRLRPGGVAFTTCYCTVGGVGEPGDS